MGEGLTEGRICMYMPAMKFSSCFKTVFDGEGGISKRRFWLEGEREREIERVDLIHVDT